MTQVDTFGHTAKGNTLPSPKKRRWCFTINNYDSDMLTQVISTFEAKGWWYIVGEEVGSKTHTKHLQGYIEAKNPIRFDSLKNIMPTAHLEAAKGTADQNYKYCSKEGLFKTNMTPPKEKYIEQPTILERAQLRDWQRAVLNIIEGETPSDRTIYWVIDRIGGTGKSALCKFLSFHNKAVWLQSGKASDMKHLLLENKNCRDIVIDLARANENFVSYTFMEELKNGYICSTKYEGGLRHITTPHLFVFANFEPDYSKFSRDRLVVTDLQDL